MSAVNIHQAKTHRPRLLERVERGERILIARASGPIAILETLAAPPRGDAGVEVVVDDDTILPEDIR